MPHPSRSGRVQHDSTDFDFAAIEEHEREEELEAEIAEDVISAPEIVSEADEERLMRNPAVRMLVYRRTAAFGSRLLAIIRSDRRARLAADCLVIAIGDDLNEDGSTLSMTRLAAQHGMTKAAISKRSKQIRENLKLPPNRYLKSDASRKTYALTNARPIRLGA